MEESIRDWLMSKGAFSLRNRTNEGEIANGGVRWRAAVKPHGVGIPPKGLLDIADVAKGVLDGMAAIAERKASEGCEIRSAKLLRSASGVVDAALGEFGGLFADPDYDHPDEIILGYVTFAKGKRCLSMQLWLSLENAAEAPKG